MFVYPRVRDLREDCDKTQKQIAELLNMQLTVYQRYERGERELPLPLTEGGSGYQSLLTDMPSLPPERYEAGTLSLPAIVGLCEGVRELKRRGIAEGAENGAELCRTLCERLACMRDVELYVPQYRGCVALFNLRGVPCEAVAAALDERGLCVRAGLHCAPLAHKTLGTDKTGAVRVSFGIYNTFADIDALCRALNDIIKEYTL